MTPDAAWQAALDHGKATQSIRRLWLDHLEIAGVRDGKLILEGPGHVAEYLLRRHAAELADLVREVSDFTGIVIRGVGETARA